MKRPNDSRRSLVPLDQESTLIAVVELSQSSWLVAGIVPGLERHPLKKLEPDEDALLRLLQRWRDEAARAGRTVGRLTVAFEAGRDGFWLARWLRARGVEAHVIHPTSVAVSREHRRAKTDRLDTELLKRAFLGWLRGEPDHCSMAAVPTLEEEDARRPNRERESLVGERTRIVNRMKGNLARLGIRGFKPTLRKAPGHLEALRTPEGALLPPNTAAELRRDMARLRVVAEQIREIEAARLEQLEREAGPRPHAMVRLLARVVGIGVETADMLVHEVLSRDLGSAGRGALCRSHRGARRERRQAAGERAGQGRQCAGAPRHDPAGVAISSLPEGQRAGSMVPGQDRRRARWNSQDPDRCSGSQAPDRALAVGDQWRNTGRSGATPGGMMIPMRGGNDPRSCGSSFVCG
jgi:transposase